MLKDIADMCPRVCSGLAKIIEDAATKLGDDAVTQLSVNPGSREQ